MSYFSSVLAILQEQQEKQKKIKKNLSSNIFIKVSHKLFFLIKNKNKNPSRSRLESVQINLIPHI